MDFDEVEAGKLDADEALDLQVVEVPETKGVANVEVGDIAEAEAVVGVLSEVELSSEVESLAEVEMLMFAVERTPNW